MAEHDLQSVAFPKLNEAQMAALDRCLLTRRQRYRDGEMLFKVGDRDFKFFVVKSGKVEIVDESGETPRTIAVQGPGEFTGDVAQLTGGPAIVNAIARGDCEVYEVSPDALRKLINDHPEPGRRHPAGVHRPPAAPERVRRVRRASRDRLALLRGTRSVSANSWPRTGCRLRGSTSRPIRK